MYKTHFKVAIFFFFEQCLIATLKRKFGCMRGAVVEWLECLAAERKVAGSSSAWAKKLENSHCSPSSEWVPDLTSKKVKGSKRRGLDPAFHMPCPRHDGTLTPHCLDSHWAKGTFNCYHLPHSTYFASDLH